MQTSQRVLHLLQNAAENADADFAAEIREASRILEGYLLPQAYRAEVGYVLEMLQEDYYDGEAYADVVFNDEDLDVIADRLWNNEWLSDQIYDSTKEAIEEYIAEKEEEEGDDFNE